MSGVSAIVSDTFLRSDWVNIMVAVASYVTRLSPKMILNVFVMLVLVIHGQRFHLCVPFQVGEMVIHIYVSPKYFSL